MSKPIPEQIGLKSSTAKTIKQRRKVRRVAKLAKKGIVGYEVLDQMKDEKSGITYVELAKLLKGRYEEYENSKWTKDTTSDTKREDVTNIPELKTFCDKFVVVAEQLFIHGEFHMIAFKQYLMQIKKHGADNPISWCERQADYIKFLFIESGKSAAKQTGGKSLISEEKAQKEYEDARQRFLDAMKNHKADIDKAKEIVEERDRIRHKELKKEFVSELTKSKTRRQQLVELFLGAQKAAKTGPKPEVLASDPNVVSLMSAH